MCPINGALTRDKNNFNLTQMKRPKKSMLNNSSSFTLTASTSDLTVKDIFQPYNRLLGKTNQR